MALRKPFDVRELLDGVKEHATRRAAVAGPTAARGPAKAGRAKPKRRSATKS